MFQPEKFSDLLSIVALVVSATSLLISALNYRRQGGLLRLHLDYDGNHIPGMFLLKLKNQGFHSIKITRINILVQSDKYPLRLNGFELVYGQEEIVKIHLAGYKEFHPIEVSAIEVIDISERSYRVKAKHLRRKIQG